MKIIPTSNNTVTPLTIILLIIFAGILYMKFTENITSGVQKHTSQLSPTITPVSSEEKISVVPSGVKTLNQLPTSTPTPIPKQTLLPTKTIEMNSNSSVKLNSVTPSSAINNQSITLSGSGFGSKTGHVWLHNSYGNAGGPPIESWSDTEIRTKVTFVGKGSFYLEVETADGVKSNKIPFTVAAGQPYISSVTPTSGSKTSAFTISGSDLGSSGSVNFYRSSGSGWDDLAGAATIQNWSDSGIRFTPPSSAENREYGIQVVTSDGRTSSYKFITTTD